MTNEHKIRARFEKPGYAPSDLVLTGEIVPETFTDGHPIPAYIDDFTVWDKNIDISNSFGKAELDDLYNHFIREILGC